MNLPDEPIVKKRSGLPVSEFAPELVKLAEIEARKRDNHIGPQGTVGGAGTCTKDPWGPGYRGCAS